MNKKIILAAILFAIIVIAGCAAKTETGSGIALEIYKSMSCGCCGSYSQYMGGKGFDVKVINTESMDAIKSKYKVPSSLQSCHTSVIAGYFVEGHVPAEAIEKLITEKPDIAGIAMAGMPSGSPGMPGSKTGPFVISAVHKDGTISEFMRI